MSEEQLQEPIAAEKKRRNPPKPKFVIIIILSVVVLAIVVRIGLRIAGGSHGADDLGGKVYVVNLQTIKGVDLQDQFKTNGDVMAANSAAILPDTSGRLVRYTVSVGQRVERGQTIAFIDPSRPGMVYSLNPIKASLSGTVASLPIELGNMVTPSTVVGTVGDLTKLRVQTYLPERYVGEVAVDDIATVELPAYPGVYSKARIVEMAPVVDPTSRTVLIKMDVTDNANKLMSGMYAELSIATKAYKGVMAVPADAIVLKAGIPYVYVSAPKTDAAGDEAPKTKGKAKKAEPIAAEYDGVAKMTRVSLGDVVEEAQIITAGLNFGDEVVIAGQTMLSDGVKIKTVKASIDAFAAGSNPPPAADAGPAPTTKN